MTSPLSLAALCLPGLERFVEAELRGLGMTPERAASRAGEVRFAGRAADALRANLALGTASRVVIDCGTFHCRSLGELVRKTARMPWQEWLRADESVAVTARAKRSRLYHTGAIAERVGEGIGSALGPTAASSAAPADDHDADDDPLLPQVLARFENDTCQLWLDTSGEPLHRRGYRLATAKAPLRPDLARALVLAAGYAGEGPLLDPFCGSGTIAIEAAGLARGTAPGAGRAFSWSRLAFGDPALERAVRAELAEASASRSAPPTEIAGSDRDAGAVEAARANAERAGVADIVRFDCRPVTDADWLRGEPVAERGRVVTNPPFGLRVQGGGGLVHLHQALGARVRALGPGWTLSVLAHDPRLARRTGIALNQAFSATHGGTRVHGLVDARDAATALPGAQPLEPGDDDAVGE